MPLVAEVSGISGLLRQLGWFWSSIDWDRPGLFPLLLVPVLFALLDFYRGWQNRRSLRLLGDPIRLQQQITPQRRRTWLTLVLVSLAWTALCLGLAGPRWGRGDADGVALGRDVLLVLDLSRSMLAEDLGQGRVARWQSAVHSARTIIHAAEARGGHRIGLIVYAAKPQLLVPLTTDYHHLLTLLDTLDGSRPPSAIRADEQSRSGTRIGLALKLAVESHDRRYPGYQDILLFTDGDDPRNDGEWRDGIAPARQAGIPVHVVGIGDPSADSLIFQDGNPIEGVTAEGVRTQALTRLRQDDLALLARECRGEYLPAQRELLDLGEFFRVRIQSNPVREYVDDALPRKASQAQGFYLMSALLWLAVWLRK
jgi:Ca-activated chloride channel family protein